MTQREWRSRRELNEGGWTEAAIDNALRRKKTVAVTHGAHLPRSAAADLWQRCGAVLSTQHPDAAVSRRTAAIALDFPWVPDAWLSEHAICVDAPRDDLTRSARQGVDRRLSLLPAEDIQIWGGLRVTSIARTAADLARHEPRGLVVPILDGLLTRGAVDRDEMHAVLRRQVRVPHVRRARGLIDLARPGPMSPRETHTRLTIIASGLPEPDVNLEIFEDGILRAQGDLGYWRWLIWIEYDGEEFHRQRREFGVDQSKDRWLSRRGWAVLRLTNRDHHRPGPFLTELEAAIREAPARIATYSPSRSPEVAAARRLLAFD